MADLRIVSINMFWRQSKAKKVADIRKVKGDADIICFQETYNTPVKATLGPGWGFHQGSGPGNTDNAIAWRTSRARLVDSGYYYTEKIDKAKGKTFKIAWVKLLIDGEKRLVVGSTHPPHRAYIRQERGIDNRIFVKHAEFFRKFDDWGDVVIGGDWNKKIKADPGGLASKLPAYWVAANKYRKGAGIDGFLIQKHVRKTKQRTIGINSDHPAVFVHLDVKTIKKYGQDKDDRPSRVAKAEVRLGTYNVRHKTKNKETIDDFQTVIIPKVDILGLQEVTNRKEDGLEKFFDEKNFGWAQPGPDKNANAIVWRKGVWNATQIKHKKIPPNVRGKPGDREKREKFATYLKLQHKETGIEIWVICAQLQPNGHPWSNRVRRRQFKAIKQLHNSLSVGGTPVFTIGDMNDKDPSKSGMGTKLKSINEGKNLDHIIYDPADVKVVKTNKTRNTLSSDHVFLWGTFKVEGAELGRPTKPGSEDPRPPKQSAEVDEGSDPDITDHEDCCAGTEKP